MSEMPDEIWIESGTGPEEDACVMYSNPLDDIGVPTTKYIRADLARAPVAPSAAFSPALESLWYLKHVFEGEIETATDGDCLQRIEEIRSALQGPAVTGDAGALDDRWIESAANLVICDLTNHGGFDEEDEDTLEKLEEHIRTSIRSSLKYYGHYQSSATKPEEINREFKLGDRVCKSKGSSWRGRVVGLYSASLTPIGYAVESDYEPGNVQVYPEAALMLDSSALEAGEKT